MQRSNSITLASDHHPRLYGPEKGASFMQDLSILTAQAIYENISHDQLLSVLLALSKENDLQYELGLELIRLMSE
jgi:hypothetical protein